MLEKIGPIKNPLSIIAIFAGISEVSGSIVLPFIQHENQLIFIYYLIAFPTLLVLSFFITLNFNNKVLYAPSDFKNEDNFIKITRFDSSKQSNVEKKVNQSEIISSFITEYSEKMESLSTDVKNVQEILITQSKLLSGERKSKPNIHISGPMLFGSYKCKVEVSNLFNVKSFLNLLTEKGYRAEIYGKDENEIFDGAEHKSIWLGKNVQLEIAIEVITLSKNFYNHLEYISISGDGDSDPPDYIHNEIFIGGSTKAAKERGLKPLSKDDFELIKEKATLVELHNFIRSFYS